MKPSDQIKNKCYNSLFHCWTKLPDMSFPPSPENGHFAGSSRSSRRSTAPATPTTTSHSQPPPHSQPMIPTSVMAHQGPPIHPQPPGYPGMPRPGGPPQGFPGGPPPQGFPGMRPPGGPGYPGGHPGAHPYYGHPGGPPGMHPHPGGHPPPGMPMHRPGAPQTGPDGTIVQPVTHKVRPPSGLTLIFCIVNSNCVGVSLLSHDSPSEHWSPVLPHLSVCF